MLGNMETLASGGADIWAEVRGVMERTGGLVTSLELVCDAHNNVTTVERPGDFQRSPLGGCDQECGQEMRCGHVCSLPCHPVSTRHVCSAPCVKTCLTGLHPCPLPCDELCGPCHVTVEARLACGHGTSVPCHQSSRTEHIVCSVTSVTELPCGHQAITPCGAPPGQCGVSCHEAMSCGHPCGLPCHPASQPHRLASLCREPCSRQMCADPEHRCPRPCGDPCPPCEVRVTRQLPCGHQAHLACSDAVTEYECSQRCERPRVCGHQCKNLCHEECGPCPVWSEAISLPCGHQVRGRCGEPPLCEAPVPASGSRGCGHSATVPCHLSASGGALALDARCDMSCAAQLLCGHQCPAPCWGCDSDLHPPCVQPCPPAPGRWSPLSRPLWESSVLPAPRDVSWPALTINAR